MRLEDIVLSLLYNFDAKTFEMFFDFPKITNKNPQKRI